MLLMRVFQSFVFIVGTLLSMLSFAHSDHHHHHLSLMVENPIIQPTPPGITNSAAYFTLMNHSQEAVTLIGASAEDVANQVEVHEHTMKDGLMRMQKVESITIGAGESLEFAPGGHHIMFLGVKDRIRKDNVILFYLHFKGGDKLEVEATAKTPSAASRHHHKHH